MRIVHSGQACNVEEERYSERVYTIKEGETLELQCLVTGHPRPQVTACWVYWERFDFVWKKTGHEMAKSEQSLRSHASTRCTCVDSLEPSVTETSRHPQRPAEVPEPPLSGATVEPLSLRTDSNHTATRKRRRNPVRKRRATAVCE